MLITTKATPAKAKFLNPKGKWAVSLSVYCVPHIVKNKCVKCALKPKHGIMLAVPVKKYGKSGKKKK